MATYALTLHGISKNNPLVIKIEATEENEKELAFLASFSKMKDSVDELERVYSNAGYYWSVGDASGTDPLLIEQKFSERLSQFLKPKLQLISAEEPREEQ